MFILRTSLAVGLVFALTVAVSAAPNRSLTARGRNSRYAIEGIVVQVHHDRSRRGAGWIKVRRSHHHRYGRTGTTAAAALSGRNRLRRSGQGTTFAVNSSTRFERLRQGGNRGSGATRTTFHAIRTGERVRILPGSGQRRAAREVVILPNRSNRFGNRRYFGNRSSYGHRNSSYRRHSLVGSRVLARHGHRQNFRVNRPSVTRLAIHRPVRHTLIEGRVARQVHRHAVAHHVAAKPVKHEVKHIVKKKASAPKHTVPQTKHPPAHKHAASHPHSSGHSHAPAHKSSSHHKR
ncbi:MAG TPA: hypothetical protein VN688_08910 [Gemmataceae bacterium]|nr:hypothetical protein [Gemmataceae bacterium]